MSANGKNGKHLLAKPGDPLTPISGEIIHEDEDLDRPEFNPSLLPMPSVPVPFGNYRPKTRRVLSDFRETNSLMNAASVIFSYTLIGIGEAEIAEATGLNIDQIYQVRESKAYSELFQTVMRELINANSEYIEARISAYSGMALNNVATIAATAKNKAVQLSASKDILDRAGHRPQDQQAKGNSGMNELNIVITKKKEDDEELEINLNIR